MPRSLRIGRIADIEVDLHWSVLVIMLLLAWSLADVTLPELAPGYDDVPYWLGATSAVVVFFASLLAHELAHSVVAGRRGVAVDRITLWLFGGVSQLHGEAATPADELRIAAAGPLTSVLLGVVFGMLSLATAAGGGPTLVVAALGWLSALNVILAIFNLLPGAPLDGGRLLHAWVWHRSGDRASATAAATRAGARLGFALIALGIALFLLGDLAAVWFVFLGWFLLAAARAEATHELLHGALAKVRVRDVMTANPDTVPEDISVAELVDDWFFPRGRGAFPVIDPTGHVTGLVTLRRVRSIDRDRWPSLAARDVADPRARVATAAPDEPLMLLLERLSTAAGDGRGLVFDDRGALVGIVSPTDVNRAVDIAALRPRPNRDEEAHDAVSQPA